MQLKIKKRLNSRTIKIQGHGEIKEVLINADMMNPEKRIISICFRGRENSGIVELNEKEAEDLAKTLTNQTKLIKTTRVLTDIKKRIN